MAVAPSIGSASDPGGIKQPSWSGAYVGLHAGYGWADVDWTSNYPFGNAAARPTQFDSNNTVLGGHVGAQLQFGPWVVGAEASLSSGYDRVIERNVDLYAGIMTGDMIARVDSLALLTGRLGYAWGNALFYGKAGYAGAAVQLKTHEHYPFGESWVSSSREWYKGWVLGSGIEYRLDSNLVFGIEYNFVHLSGSTAASILTENGGALVNTFKSRVDVDAHTLQARLSMKLDFVD
ncbi:outer membrane beta-barrel protein [Hyphomicrobium sp. CS1BSMeth3]|uniref:outer membrane protein n=1 Tax=Hyphomicrobium sp. CS1BSMeth3 TaxID=1892844 RepID=UPI0009308EDA|nr:outer membrane beta-barrel protein [Hyphomicrobium sp. CS1BSMeth3]